MILFVCVIPLTFLADSAYAFDFSEDDIRLFLPFLEHLKPPPACPSNELYKTCVSNCTDCTNRGQCVVERCNEGCDCAPRFYRVEAGGPCLPVAKCPIPECGNNEIFRECGPMCERCTTFRCRVISCDHKCYCKEGHLRNSEGKCVPEKECPQKKRCSLTEEWTESGQADEFCLNGNSTQPNKTTEQPGCHCKPGYKRNTLGFCIREEQCHLIRCLGHEIYHDCIPKCNTTCRNYGDSDCTEDDNCYPGCFCPPGYVMNDFRACVPLEECKADTEHIVVISGDEYEEPTDIDSTTPVQSNVSTIPENTTEISKTCETSEEDGKCSDSGSKTITTKDENKETSSNNAATSVLETTSNNAATSVLETTSNNTATSVVIESTTKPSATSTKANDPSSKSRKKMKTSKSIKSSSTAATATSAKQQSASDEDFLENGEF